MSEISKIIGERLRSRRLKLKYSQEQLAEKAGFHPTYIGQLERGEKNATIDSITKLCVALDYPLDELFSKIIPINKAEVIANQCYSLIVTQSLKEQQLILEILQQIIKYKSV